MKAKTGKSSVPCARTRTTKRPRERSSGALVRILRRLGLWRDREVGRTKEREVQAAREATERESGVSERPTSGSTSRAVGSSLAPVPEEEKVTMVARAPCPPAAIVAQPELGSEDASNAKYPGSWMVASVSAPNYLASELDRPNGRCQRTRSHSLGMFEGGDSRDMFSPTTSMSTGDVLRMFDASLSFVMAHSPIIITTPDPTTVSASAQAAAVIHPEHLPLSAQRSVSLPSEDQSFVTASTGTWTPAGAFSSPPANTRTPSLPRAAPPDASSRHASTYASEPSTPPYIRSSEESSPVTVSRSSGLGLGSEEESSLGSESMFSYMSMPLSTRQLLESIRLVEDGEGEGSFLW